MNRNGTKGRGGPFRALLLLLPSLVILVALEGVLHVTERWWNETTDMAPAFVLERQGGLEEIQRRITDEAGTGARGLLASEKMYRRDRDLFWTLRPNLDLDARNYLTPSEWGEPPAFTIRTNDLGLRMEDVPRKKNGARIICVGNSCTFGWGVDGTDAWPAQLGELIRSKAGAGNVEVWNAGIPGFTSYQGRRFFDEQVVAWKPDVAIISFGFNDSRKAALTDHELRRRLDSIAGRLGAYASRLHAYRFLEGFLRKRKPPVQAEKNTPRVTVAEYGANLTGIVRTAGREGITPVLLALIMPEPYHDEMKRVAASESVILIEPMPAVFAAGEDLAGTVGDTRRTVFTDPIHMNHTGNRIVAMYVGRILLERGLLRRGGP